MDDIRAQLTSGVLHAAFLLICFAIPAQLAVEPIGAETQFERWVETKLNVPNQPDSVAVAVETEHVEEFGLGSGLGSRRGGGVGPRTGDGVGVVSRAPRLGPHRRSSGDEVAEETRPAPEGLASKGEGGSDEATSDIAAGEVVDGADGGGGLGHDKEDNPAEGYGFGGSGAGCGCGGPGVLPGLEGIGTLGRASNAREVTNVLGETPDKPETIVVPSVVVSAPTIECEGCAAIIERIIRAHLREIRYCYERALERAPRLEGELMLQISIAGRGGLPTNVNAHAPMGARGLESCAEDRMTRWYFPALPNDSQANFPVRLSRAP